MTNTHKKNSVGRWAWRRTWATRTTTTPSSTATPGAPAFVCLLGPYICMHTHAVSTRPDPILPHTHKSPNLKSTNQSINSFWNEISARKRRAAARARKEQERQAALAAAAAQQQGQGQHPSQAAAQQQQPLQQPMFSILDGGALVEEEDEGDDDGMSNLIVFDATPSAALPTPALPPLAVGALQRYVACGPG